MRPGRLALPLALAMMLPALAAAQGRLVPDSVISAALAGNPLGDSPVRSIMVYLPPGYDADDTRRYPVLYLLHDAGETADRWTGSGGIDLAALLDRTIAAGRLRPLLVVMPEDRNALGASHYANSSATGAWESYFARDLVRHVDQAYRTYRRGASRGIAGLGSGGAAALRLAMRFPAGLEAVYALAPALASPCDRLTQAEAMSLLRLSGPEQLGALSPAARACLAEAAAWSPDSTRPPFGAALPFARKGGGVVSDSAIRERWQAWAPEDMAPRYRDGLVRLRGIGFDAGRTDPDFAAAASLDSLFSRLRVRHQFDPYDGAANAQLERRLAEQVLPFFSATLDFDPDTR